MKSHNAEALAHVESAIKALVLEAYSVTGAGDLPQLDHVTISEDLKRIDCAIGPKGESIFARIADRIDEAYVELLALREAIQKSGADRAPHLRLNLKPLDWDKQHQTHYANSLFGNYSIWEAGSVFYLRSPGEHAGRVVGTTFEEAKGAALRDIEERILAAIVPAPRQPFAAMTVDYLGCEFMSRDVAQIERIAKGGSKGPTPVTYLFDAPPAPQVTGIRTVAELPMTAFADAAPQRDEFNGEQTILTYSANVGTWDLEFFASGEEFPEKWFGDTHWIDISCMWPGVIAQVASFADAEGSDNDA